jgi:SAM-dependent methyltransferase
MNPTLLENAAPVNLFGDRHIEWSWLAAHMPAAPVNGGGRLLEFGPGDSWIGWIGVHKGYDVTAVDMEEAPRPYVEPRLKYIYGDFLNVPLPDEHFDVVLNCSAVEHVGLSGRYGIVDADTNGDLHAMAKMRRHMKPGGVMLLTVPVGIDEVFEPMCRVYGEQRLPLLLDGFDVQRESYWTKDDENRWCNMSRAKALQFKSSAGANDWRQNVYGLGCFVLTKP